MQNIGSGRGSARPQQRNPSAPAAADTNVGPEPLRAPASAPASAAASESRPPLLESEEHWPALDIRNYYKPEERGGRGRGHRRDHGGAGAGGPNSGEGAARSSSSSADPTAANTIDTRVRGRPLQRAHCRRTQGPVEQLRRRPKKLQLWKPLQQDPPNAPLDADKLMNQAFSWPPTEQQNAQIDEVLYGRREGHKRLPVFKDICPD